MELVEASTAARRSVPGPEHRNYSSKGTPTLTVMATGRRVSHCVDAFIRSKFELDPEMHCK